MTKKFTAEEVREKAHGYSLRGDSRTAAMLDAYADTLSKPADSGRVTEEIRDRVIEAISGALGDAYDCTRVWSAWGVGTMTEDDFMPVVEDASRLAEIADAALEAALAAQGQGEGVAEVYEGAFGVHYIGCTNPNKLPVGTKLYNRTASPAGVPDGYYLACFKHGGHGYMLWWGPDDCGYTTDLAQAGVYAGDKLKAGYHDSEYTVPVPVSMADNFRIRRMVDVGDTLNAPLHSAKALRDWLAAAPSAPEGDGGAE